MAPASPSEPSFLKVASTCIPIFTVTGSISTICEVTRQPSSIRTIGRTYGFIISYAAGASWITENDPTVPFPFSFPRSIFPTLRRPHSGHTVRGGKSKVPQFPHFEPYRLYRLPISRQNLGIAVSVHPPEEVDDRGRPRPPEGVRQPDLRVLDLPLAGFPAELTHDLHGLRDPHGSHGLSAGLQPAGRVHGDLRVKRGLAVLRRHPAEALLHEPQVLDCHNLRDCEVVMDLRDLHLLRRQGGRVERPLPRDDGRVHRRQVPPIVEGEEVGGLSGSEELHRGVCELPRAVHRA